MITAMLLTRIFESVYTNIYDNTNKRVNSIVWRNASIVDRIVDNNISSTIRDTVTFTSNRVISVYYNFTTNRLFTSEQCEEAWELL